MKSWAIVRHQLLQSLKYEGPTDPIYTGGFGNTLNYKNWRLNIFMTYGFGNAVRMNTIFKSSYSDFYAMPNEFKNRWMVPGDELTTNIPTIALGFCALVMVLTVSMIFAGYAERKQR